MQEEVTNRENYPHADWNSLVVGKLSSYIDLDNEDEKVRKHSEKTLEQELSFAGHLGLPAVMISLRKKSVNLARFLHNKVLLSPQNQVGRSYTNLTSIFLKKKRRTEKNL